MKKRIGFLICTIAISLPLVGCNEEIGGNKDGYKNIETNSKESDEEVEQNNEKLYLDGEITRINISKLNDSDEIIPKLNETLSDKEKMETFKKILLSATKEEGIANMAKAEIELKIVYEDGSKQELYLWLGEDGQKSSLMKTDDTHTVYTISEEETEELVNMIK